MSTEDAARFPVAVVPVDAELWIRDRTNHGEHVVVLTMTSFALIHPGCERPCEFDGHEAKRPTRETPMYVGVIQKDGAIGPDHHAAWEDVVAAEEARAP